MAATFARILGTEKDRNNCPFFYRIGACRHGDRCSRTHLRPHFSTTLMVPHMYQPVAAVPAVPTSENAANTHRYFDSMPDADEFLDFWEDVLDELQRVGRVDDMLVLQNAGEHMHGNTYIKFHSEAEAEAAKQHIAGRYYQGRTVQPEYSPVTDFSEAVCGMFKHGFCERGDYCNFMHARPLTRDMRKRLKMAGEKRRGGGGGRQGSSSSSRRRDESPGDRASRSRSPSVDGSGSEVEEEQRESSLERRARIAAWNSEKEKSGDDNNKQ